MTSTFSALLRRDCSAAYTDGWACYKMPVPVVVGIALGCVIFVFTLGVIIFICCRLRKRKKNRREDDKKTTFFYRGVVKPDPIPFNPEAY